MAGLLVSVRSADEAAAALAGGADIIDIKEPGHGSLGRADNATIGSIVELVYGKRPVSAALGELAEGLPPIFDHRLTFVKWGLAGCQKTPWRQKLHFRPGSGTKTQTVIVAYADWQCAQAPPPLEVIDFACENAGNVLLIDTHCKQAGKLQRDKRPTLLDWLSVPEVAEICRQCHASGVRVALAGSLGRAEMERLRGALPDWFAVRGAVCSGNDRLATVDECKVRELTGLIAEMD